MTDRPHHPLNPPIPFLPPTPLDVLGPDLPQDVQGSTTVHESEQTVIEFDEAVVTVTSSGGVVTIAVSTGDDDADEGEVYAGLRELRLEVDGEDEWHATYTDEDGS